MKLIKNIFGKVFALYALLLFAGTMLIVFIPIWIFSFFPDPKKSLGFLTIGRIWMKVYMPLIGCPVRIKGEEYFEKGKTYVVVCNHNALIDVPVTTPGVPGVNKTLAKASMGKIPLFGVLYRIGGILVDRKDEQSRKNSVVEMREALAKGMHMLLYPEGTRNRTNEPLKPFYDGAFALAIEAQVPVIPSLLFHTKIVNPADKGFYAWPHRIDYHFLPAVPTEGLTKDDVVALKEKVFKIMWDYYIANDK
ncbi:1-acyl-sn-glycerol-3-phosphate acyltransferase [Chitinophaga sp. sic0106]|uniref:lysophospholipid acyltransferase family protein n=1 Tax=Chitinophaga sp. sic0106 TaxID=2854785 RepID=UPI001C46DE47|nr:lysophospholipid acyltransferase family protein [Chitinophaga sp. sic0106]MBV7529391.1 1-acyl-sn-glycerol-3-phosphate acyltransferase [Chitinophaga sp. sic0106]